MKGDLDKAIADFTKAIAIDPKSGDAFMNRGNVWYAKKEFDKAITDFDEAIRIDPRLAFAYFGRGTAWHMKDQIDSAIADYSEAIRIDPRYPISHYNRGLAWVVKAKATDNSDQSKQKREEFFTKAIADFDQEIRINPNYADSYGQRGMLLERKGDYEGRARAMSDYRKAVRLTPYSEESQFKFQLVIALIDRARSLMIEQKFKDAIDAYTEAIDIDPKEKVRRSDNEFTNLFYAQRAGAWLKLGNFEKAIEDYTQEINLNQQSAISYYKRGFLYYTIKTYPESIKDLDKSINLDDRSSAYKNALAWILATCPDPQYRNGRRAVELAKKTCGRNDVIYEDSFVILAAAYAELGDFEEAVRTQTAAIKRARSDLTGPVRDWVKQYQNKIKRRETTPYTNGQ